MYGLTGRVPVVPGRDGARYETPPQEPALNLGCAACGTRAETLTALGELLLCVSASACCARYRAGASPESYAAGLRGEILAVAP